MLSRAGFVQRRPHGLRRTYASLRTACGDDPVFVSRQIAHEDVRVTLNVYAQSVKLREREPIGH